MTKTYAIQFHETMIAVYDDYGLYNPDHHRSGFLPPDHPDIVHFDGLLIDAGSGKVRYLLHAPNHHAVPSWFPGGDTYRDRLEEGTHTAEEFAEKVREFDLPYVGRMIGEPVEFTGITLPDLGYPRIPTLSQVITSQEQVRQRNGEKLFTDAMLRELKKIEVALRRGARDEDIKELRTDASKRPMPGDEPERA